MKSEETLVVIGSVMIPQQKEFAIINQEANICIQGASECVVCIMTISSFIQCVKLLWVFRHYINSLISVSSSDAHPRPVHNPFHGFLVPSIPT